MKNVQVVDRRDVSAPWPDCTVTNAFMFQKSNVLTMIKSKEIPIKPQNLLTIRWCHVIFGAFSRFCRACVHADRADTCMTRQSGARTSQVFFLFFFSHGKMASLTVQDVEVRSLKMICKKVIVLLQGSFYTKGFLSPLPGQRWYTGSNLLFNGTNFISHELFVFPYWLNEIWSSFFCLGFEFLPLCEVRPASLPRKIIMNAHEIFMPN